jgi:hypothetical protein
VARAHRDWTPAFCFFAARINRGWARAFVFLWQRAAGAWRVIERGSWVGSFAVPYKKIMGSSRALHQPQALFVLFRSLELLFG